LANLDVGCEDKKVQHIQTDSARLTGEYL